MVRFAVAVFPLREAVLDTTYQLLSLMLTLQLAVVQVAEVPLYVKLAVKVAVQFILPLESRWV